MIQWLQTIPAERVLLWVFLAGGAWAEFRRHSRSLRDQGRRIGRLEELVAKQAGARGVDGR